MDFNKDKLSIAAGIATAFVTGFFATVNLTIQNHNTGLTIFLYSITIISIISIGLVILIKFLKNKDYSSIIKEIVDTKEVIDLIHLVTIREKQLNSAKNLIMSLNRKILDLFSNCLNQYCKENSININPNIERTEAFIYFREILDEIQSENQKLLDETIEQNNIDKMNDIEFLKYKKEKYRLFLTTATNVRNSMYSNEICIVPLVYFTNSTGKLASEFCEDHIYKMLDQFREISIVENKNIKFLEGRIEDLKSQIK